MFWVCKIRTLQNMPWLSRLFWSSGDKFKLRLSLFTEFSSKFAEFAIDKFLGGFLECKTSAVSSLFAWFKVCASSAGGSFKAENLVTLGQWKTVTLIDNVHRMVNIQINYET